MNENLSKLIAEGNAIVRRVSKVTRNLSIMEQLFASGRKFLYQSEYAAVGCPEGEGGQVDVYLFKIGTHVTTNEDVAQEFEKYGLQPDPAAQVTLNKVDPSLADVYPNCCVWGPSAGRYSSSLIFIRWKSEYPSGRTDLPNPGDPCVILGRGFSWSSSGFQFWGAGCLSSTVIHDAAVAKDPRKMTCEIRIVYEEPWRIKLLVTPPMSAFPCVHHRREIHQTT